VPDVSFIIDTLFERSNTPGDAFEGRIALGAAALLQPYNDTCTDDVFPIDEAHRLQNLYMVAHFKRFLLGQVGYNQFLTAAYADANEPAVSFESKELVGATNGIRRSAHE